MADPNRYRLGHPVTDGYGNESRAYGNAQGRSYQASAEEMLQQGVQRTPQGEGPVVRPGPGIDVAGARATGHFSPENPRLNDSRVTTANQPRSMTELLAAMSLSMNDMSTTLAETALENTRNVASTQEERNRQGFKYETYKAIQKQSEMAMQFVKQASANAKIVDNDNCVTDVPPSGMYQITDMNKFKMKECSGNSKSDVMEWLTRIMVASHSYQLTHDEIIKLMKFKSTTPLRDSIDMFIRECETLKQLVQNIEELYGKVLPVEEARTQVQQMLPEGRDDVHDFVIKLVFPVKCATRNISDPVLRIKEQEKMYKENLMRIVPAPIHAALQTKERERLRDGKPSFTANELRTEIHARTYGYDLVRKRQSRDKVVTRALASIPDAKGGRTLGTFMITEAESSADEGNPIGQWASSEDDPQPTAEEAELSLYMQGKEQKFERQGFRRDTPMFQRKSAGARSRFYARKAGENLDDPGKPSDYKDQKNGTLNIAQLVIKANCHDTLKRCFHCGVITMPPHRRGKPQCTLAGKELSESLCPMCSRGLHQADQCPAAKMSGYQHPADSRAKN